MPRSAVEEGETVIGQKTKKQTITLREECVQELMAEAQTAKRVAIKLALRDLYEAEETVKEIKKRLDTEESRDPMDFIQNKRVSASEAIAAQSGDKFYPFNAMR